MANIRPHGKHKIWTQRGPSLGPPLGSDHSMRSHRQKVSLSETGGAWKDKPTRSKIKESIYELQGLRIRILLLRAIWEWSAWDRNLKFWMSNVLPRRCSQAIPHCLFLIISFIISIILCLNLPIILSLIIFLIKALAATRRRKREKP